MINTRLSIQHYKEGILKGDRIVLAKAITLVESLLQADQEISSSLIESIMEYTGKSIRIGITGVPGVGKSTFIEALGMHVIQENKKIAVLSVDPASQLTKGSILGDKTRMDELSKNSLAFIRPTSSGETLGGVANRTKESILLCEAAGFDVIIIETVGVGQSEVSVKNMVDFFLLLMLAGAGDELQGIKKGIMEMADAVAITKADGDNIKHAIKAQAEYQQALHLHQLKSSGWNPQVLTCSAFTGEGIDHIWKTIVDYEDKTKISGFFHSNREQQNIKWFQEHFLQLLKTDFLNVEELKQDNVRLQKEVGDQKISPLKAAKQLLDSYYRNIKNR